MMNLMDRVKRILLSPQTEWTAIDAEPSTPAQLYTGYIIPLAAIGPVAQIIGYSVIGITVPFVGIYRVPIGTWDHLSSGDTAIGPAACVYLSGMTPPSSKAVVVISNGGV